MGQDASRMEAELGQDLEIVITVGPGGQVYFHDLTADLLPVAVALAGQDALAGRLAAAATFEVKAHVREEDS